MTDLNHPSRPNPYRILSEAGSLENQLERDRLRRENEQLRALLRTALSFVSDPNVFKIQGVNFVGTREDAAHAIKAILNGEQGDG